MKTDIVNHQPACPRCRTPLDEGPVVFRCATCRRAVPAADLDTEFHAPRQLATTGASK
ncbi:hypothetical protein ACQEVF_32365 [Nonomuraea polychroma]|uniref:hypothetical protein n=1 Tax=Nonomuraea polychroma TaxID=46176 RepID=UPI003D936285